MGAQTAREALIGELIGDVDALIARMDAVRMALPEAADRSAARIEAAGNRLRAELAREGETLLHDLRKIAREISVAGHVVDGSSRRFVVLGLFVGFGGGILGGALAGALLAKWLSA